MSALSPAGASRHSLSDVEVQRANRLDWDREADDYQAQHGDFLRDVGFIWSPEGVDEEKAGLLGEVAGERMLEVGCGAAQCARWVTTRGAEVLGIDLSYRQLQHAQRIDAETGVSVPVVCATVDAIPFADRVFGLAFSAFGALPFVLDITQALREVSRVLRPGGRFVFSVVHPVRRMFADDPTDAGMAVTRSYFDRTPYVETDDAGSVSYVEPHHTLGDWVSALRSAGLVLEELVEPPWPTGHSRTWGGWGPVRGALMPGTAIFVTRRTEQPTSLQQRG
ncbi:MAG: class I SAM-dependent methyltransferase [Nocardioidaceae bacterium]